MTTQMDPGKKTVTKKVKGKKGECWRRDDNSEGVVGGTG